MRRIINLFRLNAWRRRVISEEYLKGRLSFWFVLLILVFISCLGFIYPSQWDIVNFLGQDVQRLGSDLLSGYVGILGVALAIAAIILSILQMANRQIQISELVFKNSFFAPSFYLGLLNIVTLAYLELFQSQNKIFNSEFILTRLVITQIYLFIIFCLSMVIVFYKVFSYLDFSTILTIYFRNTFELVELESRSNIPNHSNQLVSNRGRELFMEIKDCIEREDKILLGRLLDFIERVYAVNSTSNLVFNIDIELELWMVEASKKRDPTIFYTLINFWRRLLRLALVNPTSPVASRMLGIAARVYSQI